jgi:hypothetical protein
LPWSRTRGSGGAAAACSSSCSLSPSCALAGAGNFREAGDHAADLPQEVLARLGGRPHPLLRKIAAPSETRIRTLIHAIGADLLDDLTGGWLRGLADAGRLDGALTAIAAGGNWLGVLDGQVKLLAAMLHEEKVIIARHRIPDDTAEATQVRELLDSVDLRNAVVTADAVRAQRETAGYITGEREPGYFLFVKANQPSLQRAVFDAIREQGPRDPGRTGLDRSHGRAVRRPVRSPMPQGPASHTSAGSPGSAATAATPTAS